MSTGLLSIGPSPIIPEDPEEIHLMDIENAGRVGQYVKANLLIAAVGNIWLVPYSWRFRCPFVGDSESCPEYVRHQTEARDRRRSGGFRCPVYDLTRQKEESVVTLPCNSDLFIQMGGLSKDKVERVERGVFSGRKDACEFALSGRSYKSVHQLIAVPNALQVRPQRREDGTICEVDETGREYREHEMYYVSEQGNAPNTNVPLVACGWVMPNPKNQEATMLSDRMEPVQKDFRQFTMNEEVDRSFGIFRNRVPEEIARELTINVTRIYGRETLTLAMLLTYHSVQGFVFDDRQIKGWMDIVVVGDTGQGKTRAFDNLQRFIGLGQKIDGSAATRTGISYTCMQLNKAWVVKWGAFALNDGGLLCIDEGQDVSEDDWNAISSGRSQGTLVVSKAATGTHPSRTRLVILANPKHGRIVDDAPFGCQMLKKLFTTKDIRRFDLALLLSASDVDSGIITQDPADRPGVPQTIAPYRMQQSVLWAWSRRPEQIVFTPDGAHMVRRCAQRLMQEYGAATDVPLISQDAVDKVARLSVAMACLLHATDETGEEVIVDHRHVTYAYAFIQGLYSHPNCALDIHAKHCREESELPDDEYEELNAQFLEGDEERVYTNTILIRQFLRESNQNSTQIGEALGGMGKQSVIDRMAPFKNAKLITSRTRVGYHTTPRFNRWVKRLIAEGRLGEVE